MSARSHDTVLSAAAAGDDDALAALVAAYHDRVYRFGLRVCRDGFDADDAVQEAFSKLARRPDVARDPGALAWLMRVVRNACIRMLRPFVRERRSLGERVDAEEAAVPAGVDPEHAMLRFELIREVQAAVASLDAPYRAVIVLRDIEGLTGEQTSAALGLTDAAMKTRLHRARAQLRAALSRSSVVRGARASRGS